MNICNLYFIHYTLYTIALQALHICASAVQCSGSMLYPLQDLSIIINKSRQRLIQHRQDSLIKILSYSFSSMRKCSRKMLTSLKGTWGTGSKRIDHLILTTCALTTANILTHTPWEGAEWWGG